MTAQAVTKSIWYQLSDDLRRFIRRRVSSDDVAEDLLQEAFLRIHRNVDSLRGADRLAAWVYRIARNVVHDHYRRSKDEVALAESDPVDESSGENRLFVTAAGWLEAFIQQLPEPYREAVQLSEIEGLTQREVATRTGISVSGAKSRVQRGRVMLRTLLDQCCDFHFDRRGNLTECDPRAERSTDCLDCDM